jgi:hypothetical protein
MVIPELNSYPSGCSIETFALVPSDRGRDRFRFQWSKPYTRNGKLGMNHRSEGKFIGFSIVADEQLTACRHVSKYRRVLNPQAVTDQNDGTKSEGAFQRS